MSVPKIWIKDGYYDDDVVAFVRQLKKPTRAVISEHGGGVIPTSHYAVQLKRDYSLDKEGKVRTIFLGKEEGENMMKHFGDLAERLSVPARPKGRNS